MLRDSTWCPKKDLYAKYEKKVSNVKLSFPSKSQLKSVLFIEVYSIFIITDKYLNC